MLDYDLSGIEALLCDFDGTLCDTSLANYLAYSQALESIGININRTDFDKIAFGRNWRQFLPQIINDAGKVYDAAKIAQIKRDIYPKMRDKIAYNTPLWEYILQTRTTMKTGLVTTASYESIVGILGEEKISQYFDIFISGDDVKNHKPAPDAYLLAAQKLSINPKSCLAFEDSEIGIESATRAGMKVIEIKFNI